MSATNTSPPPLATVHYGNPTFGFEFDYPKAWKFEEAPGTEATLLVALAGEDGQTYMSPEWVWAGVVVFDRGMSQAFTDSEDGAQIAMAMASGEGGPIFQQAVPQTVSGHPAVRIAREEDNEGTATIQTHLFVVTDTYLFDVLAAAPKDVWEEHSPVLESFLTSFKVTAP